MNARLSVVGFVLAGLFTTCVPALAELPSQTGATPIPSLAPMIKKASPTVVGIATRGTVQQQKNPLFDDPFFRRFFDMPQEQDQAPRERDLAAGSGVVVDAKNGYIVTNAHVIAKATKITVTLSDGTEVPAEKIGADEGSDIALLKVKNTKLTAIPLGDSSQLEVGDYVVAIGNPFGLEHTVTSGIVSALSRSGLNPDGYEDFIQTDASINPGNSGGALVNLRGELIGINAMIYSQTGGNIGIGFAIPVNMVKSVMEQLIKYGAVKRGMLGVAIYDLKPDVAKAVGAPEGTQGALVSQVTEGSAAEKAGVKVNDIITSINGQSVRSSAELRNMIGLLRVGDKVDIGLLRDGKPHKLTAAIKEGSPATASVESAEIHPGLEGADLVDADNEEGVRVRAIAPRSPAARYQLRANDIIVGANRVPVRNLEALRAVAKDANVLLLSVKRGKTLVTILIR